MIHDFCRPIQAALIGQDAAVDDMVMTDVCPFTLGAHKGSDPFLNTFSGSISGGSA
jgi:hypothetical protein